MSRRKKRSSEAPMPAGSAGILSFYQEKTDSVVKIRPELVIGMTLTLIIVVLLSSIFLA
jgi:preprotein translocase subunit Sec61beta